MPGEWAPSGPRCSAQPDLLKPGAPRPDDATHPGAPLEEPQLPQWPKGRGVPVGRRSATQPVPATARSSSEDNTFADAGVGGITEGVSAFKGWCSGWLQALENDAIDVVTFASTAMPIGPSCLGSNCLGTSERFLKDRLIASEELLANSVDSMAPLLETTVRRFLLRAEDQATLEMHGDADAAKINYEEQDETIWKRRKKITTSLKGAFARFAATAQNGQIRTAIHGLLVAGLTPMATQGIAMSALSAGGVSMAFCPFCPSDLPFLREGVKVPELSAKDLERGILVATFVQGSLGLVRICLGDVFSGSYTLLLATLGYNARQPGPASNWLKTYVLITFINGTMSSIDLVQQGLNNNFPLILLGLPTTVNLAHLVSLCVPAASFLGAYCGWQHVKAQKKTQMEYYNLQIEQMLQNPPMPPPPLPDQIIRSMMEHSLQAGGASGSAARGPVALAPGMQGGRQPGLASVAEEKTEEPESPK